MSTAKKIVVIGNGMVGQRFLEQLVARMSSDAVDDHGVLRRAASRPTTGCS